MHSCIDTPMHCCIVAPIKPPDGAKTMIYLMPCIVQNTKDVETMEKRTGLTSYTIPGRTYAVLVKSNVVVFAKPATRPPITYRRNFGGGDDAA